MTDAHVMPGDIVVLAYCSEFMLRLWHHRDNNRSYETPDLSKVGLSDLLLVVAKLPHEKFYELFVVSSTGKSGWVYEHNVSKT